MTTRHEHVSSRRLPAHKHTQTMRALALRLVRALRRRRRRRRRRGERNNLGLYYFWEAAVRARGRITSRWPTGAIEPCAWSNYRQRARADSAKRMSFVSARAPQRPTAHGPNERRPHEANANDRLGRALAGRLLSRSRNESQPNVTQSTLRQKIDRPQVR